MSSHNRSHESSLSTVSSANSGGYVQINDGHDDYLVRHEAIPRSPIADFYAGKTVFMTGATGMLGMATCEKLVRCTGVATIYALVREASGSRAAAQARLHAQWMEHLPLSAARMLINSQKVYAMVGDVGSAEPHMGLSFQDARTVKREAHIFMHGAADISLVKPVHKLANINIFGALRAADFARQCMQLERYVHLSSLFSQTCYSKVGETLDIWPSTEAELDAIEREELIINVPERFLMNYSYTKHLAERLVALRYPELRTCFFRPSSIGPAMSEPAPQWTVVTSMPMVNFHAMAMKLPSSSTMIHSALPHCTDGSNLFDEVPVDYVVSGLLAHTAAGTQGPVNANAGTLNPQSIASIFEQTGSLIPKQRFEPIPFMKQRGLAKVFMLFGVQPPIGSSHKTLELQQSMTQLDKQLFSIDLQNWDLEQWQRDRAQMLRRMRDEWIRSQSQSTEQVPLQARL